MLNRGCNLKAVQASESHYVVIAKRLSVRLIIVQAWHALMGSYSEIVIVCMSVRYGFTVEIYGFRHSLHTCLARDAHDAIAMEARRDS